MYGSSLSRARRGARASLLLFALLTLAAGPTFAQSARQSLPTAKRKMGLQSGNFVLKPSVRLDGHYDTNVFNGNEEDVGNEPLGAASVRIAPALSLSNGKSTGDVKFNFAATGDIRAYFNDNPAFDNLTNIGGGADLNVRFMERRAISLEVFDSFRRDLQANFWQTAATLNRNNNNVGARVSFHPGSVPSRRPLNVSLSGAYETDRFDDFAAGNANTIHTRLSGSWRFLPRTAVQFDATWDFRSFEQQNALGLTNDSTPWRVRAGIGGAITSRITLEVGGGWGNSMHASGASFSSFLANAGLGYKASASGVFYLGYSRDFQDSFYGNFVGFHRGEVRYDQRIGNFAELGLFTRLTYGIYGSYVPQLGVTISQQERRDYAVDGGATVRIDFSRAFAVNLGYTLNAVLTDFRISADEQQSQVLDVGSFASHEFNVGVTLRY